MSHLPTQTAAIEVKNQGQAKQINHQTRVFSLIFMTLLLLITALPSPVQAYDAAWNGGREDITGHKDDNEQENCKGNECPDDTCNKARSPVLVASGSLIWKDRDIAFPAATRIGLKRTYNSFDSRAGLFGRGWVTAQETGIAKTYKAVGGGYASVPIWMAENGTRYTLTDNGSSCTTPDVLFFTFEKRADGSYKQIFEDSNSFSIFSETGYRLESYSDKDGTTVYYEYDDQQRLTKQYDSNGYTLNFIYNEQGFVAEVKDQADRTWSYLYDSYGRLEKALDPDGNSKDYSYQIIDKTGYKKHLLTEVNDNLSTPVLKVSWAESTLNAGKAMRVTGYTEIDGHAHDYTYSDTTYNGMPAIRTIKTTRQIGSNASIETQTFIADANNYRVLDETSQKIGQGGSTTQKLSYNERGKLIEILNRRGNTTRYQYNEAGQVVKATELADTDEERTITKSYYEGSGLTKIINEYGLREIRYSYDSDQRVISQVQIDLETDEQRVVTYKYHSNSTDSQGNRILGKIASIDGPQIGAQDSWSFVYNTKNQLTKATLPLNQSASYTYNEVGQLSAYKDINNVETRTVYDSKNQLIKITRKGRDRNYTYTAQGQIESIKDELGRTTRFTYNNINQPTQITYPSGDYLLINYSYKPSYTEITRQFYLINNTLVKTQISRHNPIDGFTEQEFLASTAQLANQYQRNAQNDITQVSQFGTYKNASVSIEKYRYDRLGLLQQITDGLNGKTNFSYDVFDRLTQVTDANQGNTQYIYTAQGELIQRVSSDTGTTDYQYDSVGNIIQENNANNISAEYSYDALNRLIEINYQDSDLDTILTYDQGIYGKGRLTNVSDGSGSSQYKYDDRGIIIQTAITLAGTSLNINYQYNNARQITQITYPSGKSVNYEYDNAGRISKIQTTHQGNSVDIISNINWNAPGVESYQHGNGIETYFTYDAAGRLTEKRVGNSHALQNQLDKQSQILKQTWTRNNVIETNQYQYDVLGRITQDGSDANKQFSYDAVGNRVSETQPNKSYAYLRNSNRLNDISGVNIQRDAAGNTLDDGTRQYQYNAMNRLSGINNSQNNVQARYSYNYQGQRVRKQLSGSQTEDTRYLYGEQGELLGEYQANGQVIREYLYATGNGIAGLIAEIDENGDLIYIHTDHIGTPRFATDNNQTEIWSWDSDAFGTTAANEDPDGDQNRVTINHRFVGQYYDQESALHYNHYRYYDPSIGKYITSDPIGLRGGINTYAYVGSNPISYTDPDGLFYDLLDFGFFGYSLYEYYNCPSAANALNLALDTIGLLPGIPALGAINRIDDVARAADRAMDAARASDRAADAAKAAVATNRGAKQATEGIYEFTDTAGKKYCGQSCNIPNRLKQHQNSGKLGADTNVKTTEVLGGKTVREVAEHKRIQQITGGVPARLSDKVSNKIDPIGPKREYLLK